MQTISKIMPSLKYRAELAFWRSRLKIDSGTFANGHYERLMLGMAEERSKEFLRGKIVADFGCGPRGSLVWADTAQLRIGIDVLADRYADEFPSNIAAHGMIYVKSTEKVIPLPSGCVDVLFTLNALDHVHNFVKMCQEMLRILKPGGDFVGSFNLEEPASPTEPQRLTETTIQENLLRHLRVKSYRVSGRGAGVDPYAPFFEGTLSYKPGDEGCLWVRASKPEIRS
ncbi:MAG: class I SAM-dependent methyltransferase [Terriglobales bacterium]